MIENIRPCNATTQPKFELIVQPYTYTYWLSSGRRLMVNETDWKRCARNVVCDLGLPYFFSPGIGLVEVEEEPLFGGWRCSPVSRAAIAKVLRMNVRLLEQNHWRSDWTLDDIDLYDHLAKVLAGSRTSNSYFPELKGMVFVGHTTSDGRVIKRSGFDRRTGLYAMTRKPFRAANDEPMAVAA